MLLYLKDWRTTHVMNIHRHGDAPDPVRSQVPSHQRLSWSGERVPGRSLLDISSTGGSVVVCGHCICACTQMPEGNPTHSKNHSIKSSFTGIIEDYGWLSSKYQTIKWYYLQQNGISRWLIRVWPQLWQGNSTPILFAVDKTVRKYDL